MKDFATGKKVKVANEEIGYGVLTKNISINFGFLLIYVAFLTGFVFLGAINLFRLIIALF